MFSLISVLPMEMHFTYEAAVRRHVIQCAEKIGSLAAGRKHMINEACVRHWQSMETELFSGCILWPSVLYNQK
jgi:hypothetical protein